MIAHYLQLGHPLSELLALTPLELMFFAAAWELEEEQKAQAWEAVTNG